MPFWTSKIMLSFATSQTHLTFREVKANNQTLIEKRNASVGRKGGELQHHLMQNLSKAQNHDFPDLKM